MVCKIFLFFTIFKLVFGGESNKIVYYDSYHGEQISEDEYKERVIKNTTYWCTNDLVACDPNEWRTIDGSCNNLNHPNRGMPHTPNVRLLPATYSGNSQEGYEPRKAKSGETLPSPRPVRTSLLPEARIPDPVFTQLVSHFLLFMVADVLSIHDTINYVLWKPYCCLPEGKKDKDCIPVDIPKDDPVHRFGHLRCMRQTRPLTFQSEGCLAKNTSPERIISATPTIDLSNLYGANTEILAEKARLFKDGLLKYEIEDGIMWPPSSKTKDNLCLLNIGPKETRCHDTPELSSNSLSGINFNSIWFWRLHNYIASALAKVNPCWDDNKLFYTARDINIAFVAQIIFYELWPSLMGYDNLLREGVISASPGFRDYYNKQTLPQISMEYAYILRWFHTIQENDHKMYDAKGNYLKSIPLTNITLRTGFLGTDKNFEYITHGSYRQAGGRFDNNVDPDIAEIGLGPLTEGTDIPTFDLVKNRHFGLAPYVKYLEICNRRSFSTFDDLVGIMKPEMIDIIKDKYKHVEDIDLMAGLWVEIPAEGSFLPRTMQCLVSEQLERFIVSDRHWYERQDRPHAFNSNQLLEIRKATISRVLCNVGDGVTEIQPRGFYRHGPGNEITSCKNLPNIDFQAWKDPSCGGGSTTNKCGATAYAYAYATG